MNDKERYNQIIDDAYEHYLNEWTFEKYPNDGSVYSVEPIKVKEHSKKQFVYRCKTNTEFSERWGLKIEERGLSLEERHKLALPIWKEKYGPLSDMMVPTNVDNTPYKIPTKQITLEYDGTKIEIYE